MKNLNNYIKTINHTGCGVKSNIREMLEKYFSLYGEVYFDDIECWVSIGYNENNHQGYYTYTEQWMTLNGKPIVLVDSDFDYEYLNQLRREKGIL